VARVLLVNDDIAEISAVKRVLARGGHQPVLATNAQDALASIEQATPDLLLVGATCQGGDALRRLAADGATRAIRVVVLGESAGTPEGTASVARPIDPGQLADTVAASLAVGPPKAVARKAVPGGAAPRPAARPPAANGPAPVDPAAARRAAAEALKARAAELRRTTVPDLQAAPEPKAPAPARPARAAPAAARAPAAPGLELDDSGMEAILRRAEEAERAHAAEKSARARQTDRATVEAAQRVEAERVAVEKASRARAAEERARTEERARAEAERKAAAEAAARERAEQERRSAEERRRAAEKERHTAEEERRAAEEGARRASEEEARRAAEAEGRARAEEEARRAAEAKARAEAEGRRKAEAERRAAEERGRRGMDEEARRAEEAEERARAEADARKRLEEELSLLRTQVETERRTAEERIQNVMERAAAEERASEDLRRMAEEEAQRRMEEEAQRRQSEEEQLRAAIASARAEMDTLRKKGEEEARRRAEAEAEAERLGREMERRAAEAAAQPAPFDLPVYRPPDEDPEPDPGEEAARRRVAALRGESEPAPAAAPARELEPPQAPEAPAPRRATRTPPPELRSGTLADLPAPRLLALAARAAVSGRIDLEGEVARSIWLEDGRVVGASSADTAERVEELALRLGLVTRDQHRQIAAAAAALPTRRAALLLLERGFLKPTELTSLVRRRTEEVVFGAFADAEARFRWAAEEVPPEERTALERDTLALAVEGVRRRWLAPQVDAVLGGAGTLLAPVAPGPAREDLALSPAEQRAVALADGLRTLDEIVLASPLDPLSTRQVLAALILVGALGVRMFQGGKPAAAATTAIDLARVREKLDQVRRADYFTILGVSRLCTPHEVRQAAERLAAEFEPRRYQGIREDGLSARLEEILRVVSDAREILADDRLRSEYLRGLGDER
jgi:CheY-like chemotaxis protein